MTAEQPVRTRRRWPRRLLLAAFAGLMLCGLLFGALQTPPAKRLLASRLTAVLSSSLPWPAEIEGVGGILPFVVTVDSVRLGALEAPWLEVHDAAMNLNVGPLLGGQLSIEHLGAGAVLLHHLPPSSAEEASEPDAPLTLPSFADLPAWIRLGRLQVDRVSIGEAVLGQALSLDATGAYHPEAPDAVRLNVRGLDGTDVSVSLTGGLREGVLQLELDARDATVLPALASVDGPFAVALSIDGPLSGAAVALEARRGDAVVVSLDTSVAYPEPLTVTGTGRIALPADLVPAAVLEKLGAELALEADLALSGLQTLSIQRTQVSFEHGEIQLAGTWDLSTGALELDPAIRHDDFHLLTGQAREVDPVAMAARIPLQGTLERFSIQPAIAVGGEPFLDGDIAVGLGDGTTATGAVELYPAVATTPPAFKDLLAEGADVTLDAGYAGGRATFKETRVQVGPTSLTISGEADPAAQRLELTVQASGGDLQQFSGLAGTPLGGAAAIELTAAGDASETVVKGVVHVEEIVANTLRAPLGDLNLHVVAGAFPEAISSRIAVELDGHFPGFQTRPDLARDLKLAGAIAVDELRRVQVSALDVSDGNLAVLANGTVDLETRSAEFRAGIQAAQLGDYTAIAGLPYRGAVRLDASVVSGETPGSIALDVQGDLSALSGLPTPADGLLGESAKLNVQGTYDGVRAALTALTVVSEGLELSGSGDYTLEDRQVQASATGAVTDLRPLSALAGRPLSGSASFTLEASGPVEGLDARGTISGAADRC